MISLAFVGEAVGHVSRISTYLYSQESLAFDLEFDLHVDPLAFRSIAPAWESKSEENIEPNSRKYKHKNHIQFK